MNIESHASHPSLPAFLEDIKLGFQRVHVNNPETYNLIIVEGKPAEIYPTTPTHYTVNKINIQKKHWFERLRQRHSGVRPGRKGSFPLSPSSDVGR